MRGMFQLNDPGRSSAVASTYEVASLERLTEVADICMLISVQNRNTSAKVLTPALHNYYYLMHQYPEALYFICMMSFTWSKIWISPQNWQRHKVMNEVKRNKRRGCWRFKVRWSSKILRSILVLRFRWQSRIEPEFTTFMPYVHRSKHGLRRLYHNWTRKKLWMKWNERRGCLKTQGSLIK